MAREKKAPVEPGESAQDFTKKYNEKMMRTKEALEKQEKVSLMLPILKGEPPDYDVAINGVHYVVERGKKVTVPQQVADMIMERLESEGKLSQASADSMAGLSNAGVI